MDEIIYSAGSNAARSYPVSLVFSGNYDMNDGTTFGQTQIGFYWTVLTTYPTAATDLYIDSDYLDPRYSNGKLNDFALRCINIAYGSTSARSYPVSLVYSGIFNWTNGDPINQGLGGYWWSDITFSSDISFYLAVGTSNIIPQNRAFGIKTFAYPLRLRLHFRA